MNSYAIAIMGPDRPGIVAAVTAGLLDLECNLEDVSTSILQGHFSMMLVVAAPATVNLEAVRSALVGLSGSGLASAAWPIDARVASAQPTHVLTVYGRDTTGILHAVSTALAADGVDICDMVCRLHDGDPPLYVVTIEIELPPGVGPERVRDRVAATSASMGLDSSLTEIERADL